MSQLLHHTHPKWWDILKPLAREMRHQPTPAEDVLWQTLRNRQIRGLKFRRQHAIERFIVDFICVEKRLIIECDGEIHQYTQEEDAIRQQYLEAHGFFVMRFDNEDVLQRLPMVIKTIVKYVDAHSHSQA